MSAVNLAVLAFRTATQISAMKLQRSWFPVSSNDQAQQVDEDSQLIEVPAYASSYFYCYQTEYTHVEITGQTLEHSGCISFDCKSPAAFANIFTDDNDAANNAAQAAIGSKMREKSEIVAYL
jgi:hypothetical protein